MADPGPWGWQLRTEVTKSKNPLQLANKQALADSWRHRAGTRLDWPQDQASGQVSFMSAKATTSFFPRFLLSNRA